MDRELTDRLEEIANLIYLITRSRANRPAFVANADAARETMKGLLLYFGEDSSSVVTSAQPPHMRAHERAGS
jgi:hypothetical protein